ncbi:hypothetical protein IWW34DRAFT_763531 [Fusarium oxysporum f. sp. albedinis]|nr:hypothetical protein IWW34DRAFT_763531 [Fusarium oxysporum f. sp. albedinis]
MPLPTHETEAVNEKSATVNSSPTVDGDGSLNTSNPPSVSLSSFQKLLLDHAGMLSAVNN